MVKFRKIQLDSPTSGLSAAGESITAAGGLAGAPPEATALSWIPHLIEA